MITTETVSLQTKGDCDIIDIISQVAGAVARSSVKNGVVTLVVKGSSCGGSNQANYVILKANSKVLPIVQYRPPYKK